MRSALDFDLMARLAQQLAAGTPSTRRTRARTRSGSSADFAAVYGSNCCMCIPGHGPFPDRA